MPSRISRDEMLMQIAQIAAERGTCRKLKVGAAIARDGRVVSHGYVGSPPSFPHCMETGCVEEDGHCIRTTHARYGIETNGTEMYITHSPCPTCAKAIITAGVMRVVYQEEYGVERSDVFSTFKKAGIRYESRWLGETTSRTD